MNKIFLSAVALSLLCTPALAGKKNNNNQFENWQHNRQYNETYNYNYNYNYKYKNGNNNDAWVAGVGGFLGGLIIGGALNQPPPGYYAAPTPQQFCGTQWESRWNAVYQQWEKIPYAVCWVQ